MTVLDSQTFLTRLGLSMSDITTAGEITFDVMPAFPDPVAFGSQFYATPTHLGNIGSTATFDWNDAPLQTATLTTNATLAFDNPVDGGRYVVAVTQDTSGSRTVTWPANVKWSGATAPTLTVTAGQTDLVAFIYLTPNYYGAAALNY